MKCLARALVPAVAGTGFGAMPATGTPVIKMKRGLQFQRALLAALCAAASLFFTGSLSFAQENILVRGAMLFAVGGCSNCHTDTKQKGKKLAGGHALKTPFGTFYSPNISPDKTHGIGGWSDDDFIQALRKGKGPDGRHFFPVFPYTSFTNMTDEDLKAIKAYIFTLPAVAQPNKPHDVGFPFNIRFAQYFWKLLFFTEGPFRPDPSKSPEWNRGAYLATAVAHCAECHTPRNFMGGLDRNRWMAGTEKGKGPEGLAIPNITPDRKSGIGTWSLDQIAEYLGSGALPDGDFAGSLMAEVIADGTDKLSESDRRAIAVYIKSIPPR